MRKIHTAWNWGKTICGQEGWNGHAWSKWEASDSLPSTNNRRLVTCKKCRSINPRGKLKAELNR